MADSQPTRLVRTFKYRIKDGSARKTLARHAYACNQVWNWCVARQRDIEARYHAGAPKRRWGSYIDIEAQCRGLGVLLGIQQDAVQAVCRRFVAARDARRGAPGFRSSFGAKRALGWVPFQGRNVRLDGNALTYHRKAYRVFAGSRSIPVDAGGGAFVEDSRGRWFVCFYVEVAAAERPATGAVGIDLGLKALATTSDGEAIDNPRHVAAHALRLAVAQRAGNMRRAKAIQAKIANCRRDHHHKISTRLAREYAFIAVGNVNAKALKQTRMAKSVSDAGWSAFRGMLAYKAATYVEADERFTTQVCSACGTVPTSSPKGLGGLGIRAWECTDCGASHDRDVNAARNILRVALGAQRHVDGSRPSRLRQPDRHKFVLTRASSASPNEKTTKPPRSPHP